MQITLKQRQCITAAPEDYDYGWAKTMIDNVYTDKRGKVYRLVEVEDDWHFEQQCLRYSSGMFHPIQDQSVLDSNLEYKWLIPTDDPIVVHRASYDFANALEWPEGKLDELVALIEEIEQVPNIDLQTRNGGLAYDLEVRGQETLFVELSSKLSTFLRYSLVS